MANKTFVKDLSAATSGMVELVPDGDPLTFLSIRRIDATASLQFSIENGESFTVEGIEDFAFNPCKPVLRGVRYSNPVAIPGGVLEVLAVYDDAFTSSRGR